MVAWTMVMALDREIKDVRNILDDERNKKESV